MCQSLNLKAPNIGVYKFQSLLATKCANLRVKLHGLLQGKAVSVTTDAWTSCNNITVITCTSHLIDPKTWLLLHMPLGLFQKSGTSHAEDVVRYVEGIWERYNIEYANITCIVTDTEAPMVKATNIFCDRAEQESIQIDWHGCIDHLLNLVTKIALEDFAESDGAMNAAKELVKYLVHLPRQKRFFSANKCLDWQ